MATNVTNCCQMVGDLYLGIDGCIVSFSESCNTEMGVLCGTIPLPGPTLGTVSMTALVENKVWVGCPAKAGVSISFIQKYECDYGKDEIHFIFNGEGTSYYTETPGIEEYIEIKEDNKLFSNCTTLEANSSSGPSSFYTITKQVNGYGLSYKRGPISFDTDRISDGFTFPNSPILVNPPYFLQNFSLDLTPGSFPMASYTFAYAFSTTDFNYPSSIRIP